MPDHQLISSLLLLVGIYAGGGHAEPCQSQVIAEGFSNPGNYSEPQQLAAQPRKETEPDRRPFAPREYVRIIKPPR